VAEGFESCREISAPVCKVRQADERPANTCARIFKRTVNDSPSPWRRGPG
jgi:hypothetical protein